MMIKLEALFEDDRTRPDLVADCLTNHLTAAINLYGDTNAFVCCLCLLFFIIWNIVLEQKQHQHNQH